MQTFHQAELAYDKLIINIMLLYYGYFVVKHYHSLQVITLVYNYHALCIIIIFSHSCDIFPLYFTVYKELY